MTTAMLTHEFTLSLGLRQHGIGLFNGVTSREDRKHRAREAIKHFALADEKWGSKTYRDLFAYAYEERL